jgi:thioredoxin-related protein
MKAFALLLTALAFISSPLSAAEDTWLTDLPKAMEQAKAQKKMVLLDFTGSDWCPPCKALHKNVLTSGEFSKFAKDNLVLVELDFPKSKAQTPELKAANQELSKKYAVRGFPTIIVLDADGKELFKKVGYGGTPAAEYVAELAKLKK